jgi:hypothetical protein
MKRCTCKEASTQTKTGEIMASFDATALLTAVKDPEEIEQIDSAFASKGVGRRGYSDPILDAFTKSGASQMVLKLAQLREAVGLKDDVTAKRVSDSINGVARTRNFPAEAAAIDDETVALRRVEKEGPVKARGKAGRPAGSGNGKSEPKRDRSRKAAEQDAGELAGANK